MELIYIAGDNRSGSTMLDMMLSGHSQITSIGEAHQLKAYATENTIYYEQTDGDKSHKMRCFCGERLCDCEFWRDVENRLGRSLSSLDLKLFFIRSDLKGQPLAYLLKKMLWAVLNAFPSLYINEAIHYLVGGVRTANESIELFEAVSNVAQTRYVLDSSKSPHRMYSLYKAMGGKMKVILLCRDYKGTIYSKMKRGVPMFKAALQWKWTVQQMELYAQKFEERNVIRVRYEDICTNTRQEMLRLCAFLGLEYEPAVECRNTQNIHHLGGSPSKYAGQDTGVSLDTSYERHLSYNDRKRIYRLLGKEAALWGYGV